MEAKERTLRDFGISREQWADWVRQPETMAFFDFISQEAKACTNIVMSYAVSGVNQEAFAAIKQFGGAARAYQLLIENMNEAAKGGEA